MYNDATDPASYAQSVASAVWELASDAQRDGAVPKPMAVTMEMAAADAARRLGEWLGQQGRLLPPDTAQRYQHAVVDLEMLAELAQWAVIHQLTPRDAKQLSADMRYTAERIVTHISRIADD